MKKILLLFITLVLIITSTACSNETFKISDLKYKKDIGAKMSEDFGIVFLKLTEDSIGWYNNYVTNNNEQLSDELAKEVSSLYIDIMTPMLQLGLLNETEKEMVREQKLDGHIINIMYNNEQLENEDNLREKNLGKMNDEKYEELLSSNETSIIKLKEEIERILNTYYE